MMSGGVICSPDRRVSDRCEDDVCAGGHRRELDHRRKLDRLREADASIAAAMNFLTQRERAMLHLRFAPDLTQGEIAARIGISQMQIWIMRVAMERLRILVGADENPGSA
jgi:DNA-directed RNA polymerase specialized sigma subunit